MTSGRVHRALVLDTGALLALERGDARMRALLRRATEHNIHCTIPAGVVAQAWRGGPRQTRIARLLADPTVEVRPLDELEARAVGLICERSGHNDIVDVHVALVSRDLNATVVTSDAQDLRNVDPALALIEL